MSFRNPAPDDATARAPLGLLLTNVGSPAAPTTGALRAYLAQFLGDPRVIEYPRWLWQPLLHGVILNVRPRRSAGMYRQVWTADGSPLLAILRRQAAALQEALGDSARVAVGVRYGEPSIAAALRELDAAGARRVLVLPLYPQYSATTTATSLDAVFDELRTWRRVPELRTINQYYDHPGYIAALAASVREHWAAHGRPQRLLLSYHGIPRDYADQGDPYSQQCAVTTELLVAALGLGEGQYGMTFQSRFGPSAWLLPATDTTLEAWGREGLALVDALCPGFSADCLETLEEIAQDGAHAFHAAGGGQLRYIPALNDRPDHVAALAELARANMGEWPHGPLERYSAGPEAVLSH